MEVPAAPDITHLLRRWKLGNSDAAEQLPTALYEELRRTAGHYMRQEREGHTLNRLARGDGTN